MSDTTCHSSTDQERDHERSADRARCRRRSVLAATGAAVAGGLAGCLGGGGGDGDAPGPVTLDEDDDCDVCGMVISQHPGPTAEVFYADVEPAGHENPARFDSTWEAFQFDFEHDDWTREAFYVTDYSSVDYSIQTGEGEPVISTHYDAESFADATDVTFVADSEVVGAMGRDLVGFTDRADAEAFRDGHGGDLVSFDDVTPEVVSSLGR
ncbi:nitrous oxide reductase accessory protein NosL [Halobacterium yunchengense]|uniref:nitrous oxide reductase accessory protein NosL n=1 Tax=Halobacterium yunchengense TaxID=3108497 RepID=UPI003008464D